MLPDGWKTQPLQAVAPVIDCKHRTPTYVSKGVPIVSPGNIAWGPLRLDNCRQVSENDYSELMNHCTVRVGDLVFGRNQSVGISSVVVDERPFALGQDTVLIQPQGIAPTFLSQWLKSPLFEKDIRRLLGGSTFGRINLQDLRQLSISTPPLLEQWKIAEILSTWDMAIAAQERLIANAKAQKKALMQTLLTAKKRLPGFSGEWKPLTLRNIATIVYGTSPNGIALISGTVPVIGTGGVVGWTDQKTDDGPAIIIGRKGTIDKPQLINRPFWAIDTTYFCKPKAGHDLVWLYYNLQSLDFRALNEASGVPSLSRETLYSVSLKTPKLPEQQKIGQTIKQADTYTAALIRKLDSLRQEKLALMQQLLTGKRCVKIEAVV